MVMNKESTHCGQAVLSKATDCFVQVMVEHIDAIDFRAIVQMFNQELIKCCRVLYQVVTAGSPSLNNQCFFMASVYYWLINQHQATSQYHQIQDPVTIQRIHSALNSTDASVLTYFIDSYNSVCDSAPQFLSSRKKRINGGAM